MLLVMVLAPIVGALFTLITGIMAGGRGALLTATLNGSIVLCTFWLILFVEQSIPAVETLGTGWFTGGNYDILWGWELSPRNTPVVGAVVGVALAVMLYSGWYIASDPHVPYFLALIQGFMGFMLLLLTGNSTPLIFIGWEGIGVFSFLLISFWHTRTLASQAAIQGFVINRVGDLFLILAIVVSFNLLIGGNYAVGEILPMDNHAGKLTYYLLLGGAAGKSAQIGLHAWLPSAIEAPTPISALIHAATLVTAGVYLLVQMGAAHAEFLGGAGATAISTSTLLLAGAVGLTQTDIKRTIAFSTCSQVSFMVLGVSNNAPGSALFLLLTHALYKALLFISAGVVIHASGNLQDSRQIGGGGLALPVTKELFVLASLALCAVPFSAGDFSKDLLIEQLGYSYFSLHQGAWICALAGTVLTGLYSGRLLRTVFNAESRVTSPQAHHEPSKGVQLLLISLGVGSVSSGALVQELIFAGVSGQGTWELASSLKAELVSSFGTTILPLGCVLLGLSTGLNLSQPIGPSWQTMYTASINQAGWELTVPRATSTLFLTVSRNMSKLLDLGAWETLGSHGLATLSWQPSLSQGVSTPTTATHYLVLGTLGLFTVIGTLR